MFVIWEKGVVSVLVEQCCLILFWFGLGEINVKLSRMFFFVFLCMSGKFRKKIVFFFCQVFGKMDLCCFVVVISIIVVKVFNIYLCKVMVKCLFVVVCIFFVSLR